MDPRILRRYDGHLIPTARRLENWCDLSNRNLVNLLSKKFIARPDAKAQQSHDGKWFVDTTTRKADGPRIPWSRDALEAHLAGTTTYGHYLLSQDSECKLFAFDIDLEKKGVIPGISKDGVWTEEERIAWRNSFYEEPDLRAAWLNRRTPGRDFIKLQFKLLAHRLCGAIVDELGIPCAVAYSGGGR